LASYLNPANLINLTPEINDTSRLFNAYQSDLPRKEYLVDEVECWKIRWALVDDKPERLLDTLHATNRDFFSLVYEKPRRRFLLLTKSSIIISKLTCTCLCMHKHK
jgi:hypothetical protein